MSTKQENLKLQPGRFNGLEFKCNRFQADIPVEHSIESLTDPAYWSMLWEKFSPFDEVRALAEDGSWIAYLIVREVGKNYVHMHVDRLIQMEQFDPNIMKGKGMSEFDIIWRGLHSKWCVERKKDNQRIHEFANSQTEAANWLRDHVKAQAA